MDEIDNLILQVKGEDELKALNKQLDNEKRLLMEIAEQRRTGIINEVQFAAASKATAGVITGLNQQVATLNRSFGLSTQAGLQLSYALDDLVNTSGNWDRHLAAIGNNIPGLAMSFKGMGEWGDKIAAAAGPIGLVSTAIIAMAPLAKMAWSALTDAVPAEIMGELADRAKKLNSELEKLRASKTPTDVETQKGFEDLFAGQSADIESGIAGGLARAGGAQMNAKEIAGGAGRTDAEIDAAVDSDIRFQGQGAKDAPTQKAALRAARDVANLNARIRINASNQKTAGELFAQASTNPNVRQRIRDMATANPDGFPRGFAADMASMEPGASDEFDAAADEFESGNQEWRRKKEAAQSNRKAKKAAERVNAKAFSDAIKGDEDALGDAAKQERDSAREAARVKREADALARKNSAQARAQSRIDARAAKGAPLQNMTNWFSNNTDANPAQAAELADRTLDLMRDTGIPAMQATQIAYQELSQKYMKLQMQLQAIQAGFMRANNRQLGGDNFSFQSPMPGG